MRNKMKSLGQREICSNSKQTHSPSCSSWVSFEVPRERRLLSREVTVNSRERKDKAAVHFFSEKKKLDFHSFVYLLFFKQYNEVAFGQLTHETKGTTSSKSHYPKMDKLGPLDAYMVNPRIAPWHDEVWLFITARKPPSHGPCTDLWLFQPQTF